MHDEARAFIAWAVEQYPGLSPVVECGSLNVNGEVRDLFGAADYHGIDLIPGPGVDEFADFAEWTPDREYAAVVCCEVLEHTPKVDEIIASAHRALEPAGLLILTCATDPRAPHGADGGPLLDGEWYRNIPLDELERAMTHGGFSLEHLEEDPDRGDLYAIGCRQ